MLLCISLSMFETSMPFFRTNISRNLLNESVFSFEIIIVFNELNLYYVIPKIYQTNITTLEFQKGHFIQTKYKLYTYNNVFFRYNIKY